MPKQKTLNQEEQRLKSWDVLLNGLGELGSIKEPLVDYAYSMALESVTSSPENLKLLAEAMHNKWLSDPQFPPMAVRLTVRLGDVTVEDVTFRSMVYSMILNDYKDRQRLRKISRTLFCNSVHFTFEFMRYFYVSKSGKRKMAAESPQGMTRLSVSRSTLKTQSQASLMTSISAMGNEGASRGDVHIYAGMVEPMFDYMQMLIDDSATEQEIALLHYLMFLLGQKLEKLKPSKMQNLMFSLRRKLIEGQMVAKYRALLMELVEIQSHKWQLTALSQSTRDLYMKYRPATYDLGVGMMEIPENESSGEED